jgi:microcystin-dependent protein
MKFRHLLVSLSLAALVAGSAWAVSFTQNKGYLLPTVSGDPNVWGGYLNQTTTIIDTNMGGEATVSVAGSSNVTATSTQAQNLVQNLTGALTGNISYILPATGSFYIINNATSGAFTVTVITSAGGSTGPVVPQGQAMHVWSDATNIYPANGSTASPAGNVPVGSGMEYWGTAAPSGWIFAYGQTLGTTTCPLLFNVVSYTYGGSGSSFLAPDMRGRVALAKDNMGGSAANRITSGVSGIVGTTLGASGGSQLAQADTISLTGSLPASTTVSSSATSTVTDPGHQHTLPNGTGGGSVGVPDNVNATTVTGTSFATTGITVATSVTSSASTTVTNGLSATSGLTGTTQNVQPGIVSNYIINAGGACS